MIKYIIVLFTIPIFAFNNQPETYNLTPLKGRIEVICSSSAIENISQPSITCRRDVLDPAESDFWNGPIHPLAHFVEMLSFHEDGSNKFIRVPYNGSTAKTQYQIQLWSTNLFEGPLLRKGLNKIHYELKGERNETLLLGDFEIKVIDGPTRKCPNSTIDLTTSPICPEAAVLCETYFSKNNYCR